MRTLFASRALDALPVAALCFERGVLVDSNREWAAISRDAGIDEAERHAWLDVVHPDDRDTARALIRAPEDTEDGELNLRILGGGGSARWFRAHIRSVGGHRDLKLQVLTLTSVGPHRSNEARLLHLSTHDGLTGLANRASFVARVSRILHAGSGEVGMLFIDLDRFKTINDRLGHRFGNDVLRAVCQRIEQSLRSTELTGRLGGDEIGVCCPHIEARRDVFALAERIGQALAAPFRIDTETVCIDASIGIAFSDVAHVTTAEELIERADRAMYVAKGAGGGRWATADERVATGARTDIDVHHRVGQMNALVHDGVVVAQATGMIAQRTGCDATGAAAMLHSFADARGLPVAIAARALVERTSDIDAVAIASGPPSPAMPFAGQSVGVGRTLRTSEQVRRFNRTYGEHSAAVYGCAALICGDAAARVTEQAFVEFWQRGDGEGSASARFQLVTIAHRLALRTALSAGRDDAPSADAAAVVRRGQAIERTLACAHLDGDERTDAALVVHGRCTTREVARILDRPEGEVHEQLRAGMRHVRAVLSTAM